MNTSGQQKKTTTTSIEKKLNELPDSVILHILSLIDTQKTVQTCVLSYRWSRLWTHLPCLSFDSTSFKDRSSFKKFVLGVLSRRKACNIHSLRFWNNSKDKHFINKVFDYAARHAVQEININSEDCFVPCFLSYQSLTTLIIESCSIHHHNFSEHPMFASLTTLYLEEVFLYLERDSVDLFSSCVNLEKLSLIDCSFKSAVSVKISSPRLVNLTMKSVIPNGKIIISTPRLPVFNYESRNFTYGAYGKRRFDSIAEFFVDGCSIDRVNIQIGTDRSEFNFIKDYFGSNLNSWYQKVIKKIFPKTQSLMFQFGGCKALIRQNTDSLAAWLQMIFVRCLNHLSIDVHGTGIDEGIISLSWKLDRSDNVMDNLGVDFFGTVSFVFCPIIFMTLNLSRMELESSLQGLLHESHRDVNQNKMKKTMMLSELPAFQAGFQMAWENVLALTNKPLDIQISQKNGTSDALYQPIGQYKSFLSRNGQCNVTRTLRGKIIWQMQWPN